MNPDTPASDVASLNAPLPFHLTTGLAVKTIISTLMSLLGMYYLAVGKKNHDFGQMVWGGILIVGAMFIF